MNWKLKNCDFVLIFKLFSKKLDEPTKIKFIEEDKKVSCNASLIEIEKRKRKERHREWLLNHDERYNEYYNLINNSSSI